MEKEQQQVVPEDTAKEYRLKYLQKFMGLSEEESRNLIDILTQPTPEDIIETRPARGGARVPYVPGPNFIKRFNDAFGFLWSFECPSHFELNGQIVVKGRWSLEIPGRTIERKNSDGSEERIRFDGFKVVKEQFGSSEIKRYTKNEPLTTKKGVLIKDGKGDTIFKHKAGDVIDLGDDYKGAATDAMKKCGTELGMFLDVYSQRSAEEEGGVSKKSLESFYMRAERAGMNEKQANEWAEKELGKPLMQADQLEAMQLIPKLIDMEAEAKV